MEKWLSFISIISSFSTLIGFIAFFIKLGREKGESEANLKELRKDIDENKNKIDKLADKVNESEVENGRLIASLSSDLGWIKSSLTDIKNQLSKKE